MKITCPHCTGSGTSPSTGEICHVCDGDQTVEAKGTHTITEAHAVETYTIAVSTEGKVDDILETVDQIKEKVDEIKTVVDGLS